MIYTRLRQLHIPLVLVFLVFVFASTNVMWGQHSVRGTVKDSKGESVIGANVVEKGTTNGTITDIDGKFTLPISGQNPVLSVSYIGYKSKNIDLGSKKSIDIILEEDVEAIDEVVVVGYGTMKKSDLTGSVARVSLDEKTTIPNVNLSQALSGASPGLNVTQTGLAGGDASLSIRGQTSLSADDGPLIVLDGIIYNGAISDINPNDVQYIDVLKDASSAAVYGSRSANGVVIITTKKGKSDKPKVSFNGYYGAQDMTNNPMKVMNAEQYALRLTDYYYQQNLYAWYKTAPTSDVGKPVYPDVTNKDVVASTLRREEERVNYKAGNDIDWVKEVQRKNATIQSYNVNVSGGNDKFNYYTSGSYVKEEGILKNDQFSHYTLTAKMDSKITDWFSIGTNINYSYRDYSGLNASLEYARKASPLANYDLDSPDHYAMYLTGESYMAHPLGYLKALDQDISNNIFFVTSAHVDCPWIKGLSYDFNYSNTYYNKKKNTFWPSSIADGSDNKGKAQKSPEDQRSWIYNNIITYTNEFGDHSVNATLLYSREKHHGESYNFTAQGFDNEALGFDNMTLGTVITTSKNTSWEEMGISYMARLNYQYKHRYLLSSTIRRDGYSGFGTNNKYVTLPALSLGWVASNEDFNPYKNLYLKFRLSYGQNGNQGIGRYSSLSQMANAYYTYGSTTAIGVYPNTLGNASLKWEKTNSLNLGIDYGFFDRRINGSIELYTSKTTNVLVKRNIPTTTGYDIVWTNIGGLNNKGVEFEVNTINLKTPSLQWETGLKFSLNRDKITKLYEGTNEDIGNSWFVGESISSIYDYHIIGMWQEEDLYNGKIYKGWYPGQYKYEDLNGDGVIDPQHDRKVIGKKAPNYRFSITSTFTWKDWTLYFLLNSVQGGHGYYMYNNYDVVNVSSRSDDVYRINQSNVRHYWTPQNRVDNATGIYNSPAVTSGVYENRAFVRLQDISLTYNFNKKLLSKMGPINMLQLYLAAKNIYTWTGWSGWDPELASKDVNYPAMRNVTMGIKLSF